MVQTESGARLIGRDKEAAEIERCLSDASNRLMVISGAAGAGKTALAEAALQRAQARGWLVGCARHLPGADGDDLLPAIHAIEHAVRRGLDTLYEPDAGFALLEQSLGTHAAAFTHVGAGPFRRFKAPAGSAPAVGVAAIERTYAGLFIVLRWLLGFGQPVLFLLDDWGRARGAAAEFYQRLAEANEIEGVRIVATQRTDEPASWAPRCAHVALGAFPMQARRDLVAARTRLPAGASGVLAAEMGAAAETPFGLIQVLRDLEAQGGLGAADFDRAKLTVCLDKSTCADVVRRLAEASAGVVELGAALDIFGDRATIEEASVVLDIDAEQLAQTAARLERAGVLRRDGAWLGVSHDKFREAFADLTDARERQRLCFRVADYLHRQGLRPESGARGVLMLERFVEAEPLQAGPTWVGHLCAGAAQMRTAGDLGRAVRFAEAALALCDKTGLAPPFAAVREGVLAAVERADNAAACARAELLHAAAGNAIEMAQADELSVFAYRMSDDLPRAVAAARAGLRRVGVRIPEKAGALDVVAALVTTLLRDPDHFAKMPVLTPEEIAIYAPMIRAANAIGSLVYEHDAALAFVIAARAFPDVVIGGAAAGASAQVFLCAEMGLYRRAARWAALSDARQGEGQPLRAAARHIACDFGHYISKHRKHTGRGLPVRKLGYADGDLVVVSYSYQHEVFDKLMGERPLAETVAAAAEGIAHLKGMRDATTVPRFSFVLQMIENMRFGGAEPWRLAGEVWREEEAKISRAGLNNTERGVALYGATLGVVFGAYDYVGALHELRQPLFDKTPFHSQSQQWTFMTALALLKCGRTPSSLHLWLLRRFARNNPVMQAHRVTLLDAERARLRGRRIEAMKLYARALEEVRGAECYLERGIVAEAAREGCAVLGEEAAAQRYKDVAGETWALYGADGVLEARGHAARTVTRGVAPSEADLAAAREAAEQANAAKSRFLALVGHELRAPLQGLSGLLEVAEGAGRAPDIGALRKSVAQLSRSVADLIDFAVADADVLSLASAPFDVRTMLDHLVAEKSAAAPVGCDVCWSTDDSGALRFVGDEVRVRQVVSNLVGNALTHAATDVEVRLSLSKGVSGETLRFDVLDRGPGLPIEAMARLLEPFERGATAGAGLGLGLALSRRLAKAMGGELIFANRPEGGAQCSFVVPLKRAGAQLVAAAHPRVLLVEDEELSRDVISALLRLEGCSVQAVADVGSALAAARTQAFELVLADAGLAGEDGLDVLAAMKRDDRAPPPVLALMTAGPTEAMRAAAAELGLAALLLKPISRASLASLFDREAPPATEEAPRLAEVRAVLGAQAGEVLASVRPRVLSALEAIEVAARSDDWAAAQRDAHRLAGLAAHFGLDDLAKAALGLSRAGRDVAPVAAAARAIDWAPFERA